MRERERESRASAERVQSECRASAERVQRGVSCCRPAVAHIARCASHQSTGLIPSSETVILDDIVVATEPDRVLAELKEVFDKLGKHHTPMKL